MFDYKSEARAWSITAENAEYREEQLRMQLAACGVAAMQNTEDSKAERLEPYSCGWSTSYGDVCSAVDREIKLRNQVELLKQALLETQITFKNLRVVTPKMIKAWRVADIEWRESDSQEIGLAVIYKAMLEAA